MRGYDIIREFYLGNLRPCDRSFRTDTDFAITMDAFTTHEKWFRENLNGETGNRFLCHHLLPAKTCHRQLFAVMGGITSRPSSFCKKKQNPRE